MKTRMMTILLATYIAVWAMQLPVHAQSENAIPVDAQLQQAINNTNNNAVQVAFCDKNDPTIAERNTHITTAPGEIQDLCISINNSTMQDQRVMIEIVDGTFTSNTNRRSCSGGWVVAQFGQYVRDYPTDIVVPAQDTRSITGTLQFPAEKMGEQIWCLAYRVIPIEDETNNNDGGMNVIVRNVQYIDVFVVWDIVAGVELAPLDIVDTDEEEQLSMTVENIGGIDQRIERQAQLRGIVWANRPISTGSDTLSPQQLQNYLIPLPDFPWYQPLRTAEVTLTHHVEIGNIDPTYIDSDLLEPHTITATIRYLVIPRIQLAMWLIIILIALLTQRLIRIYRLQQKHLHEMQAEIAQAKEFESTQKKE